MPHFGEHTSNLAQTEILKEKDYVDFFLNCARASKTLKGGQHIRSLFTRYGAFVRGQMDNVLPDKIYGIDSSHIEQPLDINTGQTRRFLSELMLISTLSEVEIDTKEFVKVEKQYQSCGSFPPEALSASCVGRSFNFWFNGANLTPSNIANDNFRNPKNGFKVAVRDALKKPNIEMVNPNQKPGVVKTRSVSTQAKQHKHQNFRLIDTLYELFRRMHQTPSFAKFIPDFQLHPHLQFSVPHNTHMAAYNLLKPLRCPNHLDCPDPLAIARSIHRLGQYRDTEVFCPSCGTAVCELDTIGLTEQFQQEMSNLVLLSDMTYLFEHLRAAQRLLCLQGDHNTALIMDGTLGLFRKLQLLTPGIKDVVQTVLDRGSTVFGVVKHSETKDFFDHIDHPLDPSQSVPSGSFWVVRNRERYKFISPRFHAKDIHGKNTHYGVDVMVKTIKGCRFLVSVALPATLEKSLQDQGLEPGSDGFLDHIQTHYQEIPCFVKMLATLEKVQMLLYGGSTIPQTLTHGQASISWNVSGRILAQAIVQERMKGGVD